MTRTFPTLAAVAAMALASVSAAHAQTPVVDLDTAVDCAVVFGIIVAEQQRGTTGADRFPPLAARGKEFFVRVGARLIDERHLTRDQAREHFQSRAMALQSGLVAAADPQARLNALAGPCLGLLDATIPAP